MNSVCYKCEERHEACWGSCDRYQEAKAIADAQRKARQQAVVERSALNHVQYYGLKRKAKER